MLGSPSTTNPAPLLRVDVEGREHYLARGRVSLLPVDLREASRLDVRGSVAVPVNDIRLTVLLSTYGTALWLAAMRVAYPKSMTLVGIDHTIFETSFTQTEQESPVDYNDETWSLLVPEHFDFVHMSNLSAGVRDWSKLLQTAHRYCKPSTGKIELVLMDWQPQSYDKTLFPEAGKAMLYWYADLMKATTELGLSIAYPHDIGELLQLAGFVDVGCANVRIPMCEGRLDSYEQKMANEFRIAMGSDPLAYQGRSLVPTQHFQAYQGMSMVPFTQHFQQTTPSEVNKICERVAKIPELGKVQLYHDLYIWTARKP
ncbi:hypothetical protein LTR56_024263 [Elasticomyces elasticus]|nr:hypothetical protein LTR56_024263 [Elasticomyces elasticus]KAK3641115.1 hypothetical protein LTR22_016670 [Elasticomyces elasticus]KAK4905958.1 hypothetical protein LTR49_024812 [Elasticomyces elasticus]KAK5743556.1 hypothetical protein LTS12_023838 [Elasticomyces elasticus]